MSNGWNYEKAQELFSQPFQDLLFAAHSLHRQHFCPNTLQISSLVSIKTGGCSENCGYCSQSSYHPGGLKREPMLSVNAVKEAAARAKEAGATRLCMGASGRSPRAVELQAICEMIQVVKEMGLETCATLGLLNELQVEDLKKAGLDYYNHNIDTSPEYYSQVVTTRTFQDRLQTLDYVRKAGLKICCGGILGMGESNEDRIRMLLVLACFPKSPESIPINQLIPIPGTPLAHASALDPFDFVRTIALARLMMPTSSIRLSAGRETMSDELQALCFFVGANSVFYGEKLLTANNSSIAKDDLLFSRLQLSKSLVYSQTT